MTDGSEPASTTVLRLKLTLALESVELVEERGDVNDDTRADEGGDLGVDQT